MAGRIQIILKLKKRQNFNSCHTEKQYNDIGTQNELKKKNE